MIRQIATKLDFPTEAVDYLAEQQTLLLSNSKATALLGSAMDDLFMQNDPSLAEKLGTIATETGIHSYTVDMIFLLLAAYPLRYLYLQKGIDEKIYIDTLKDLKYKLMECKKLHGVWGTFVGQRWYPRFFRMELFALGRLQYETKPFAMESYKDLLKKDEPVCNCHIPSSGTLLKEDVIASLKQAYEFFPHLRRNGILPITCNSWLLYPPVAELFKKDSNMEQFYKIFEVLSTKEQEHNTDFWRIFNLPFSEENLQNAPEDSSLQRNVKAFLQAGNHLGAGLGIILFDGENILTQR